MNTNSSLARRLTPMTRSVRVPFQTGSLDGSLILPPRAAGLVLFPDPKAGAHHKPHNRFVAKRLAANGFGVLQVGLQTEEEEMSKHVGFGDDLGVSAVRLATCIQWARQQPKLHDLSVGCLGFGEGATAALMTASALTAIIDALMVVDGQPDWAMDRLARIRAATLLVASDKQPFCKRMNEIAYTRLHGDKGLEIIPGSGAVAGGEGLELVVRLAIGWFRRHLGTARTLVLEVSSTT
jgi:dienelactone hydrolase